MAQQGPRPLAHRTALRTHEAHLAANGGDALAQCNLGFMHKNGAGVAQNDEEAVKWFRLARIVMYYFEVSVCGEIEYISRRGRRPSVPA